jgi:hypothetical protein
MANDLRKETAACIQGKSAGMKTVSNLQQEKNPHPDKPTAEAANANDTTGALRLAGISCCCWFHQ